MKIVTTRVPATTANLGPGYDCLGVALGIANLVTVQPAEGIEHPKIVADAAALFSRPPGSRRLDLRGTLRARCRGRAASAAA